jgi:hypothetical protein
MFAAASRDRSLGIADRVEVLRLGRASSSSLSQPFGTNPTRCPRPAPAYAPLDARICAEFGVQAAGITGIAAIGLSSTSPAVIGSNCPACTACSWPGASC